MKPLKRILIFSLIFVACNLQAQDPKVVQFRIEGFSCSACANSTQSALNKMEGVDSAKVSFDTKQATVYASGGIDEEKIKELIRRMNFEPLFGEENLTSPLTEEERSKLDIVTIKGGDKINFQKHLSKEKITIFDFYADWCGPCKVYSPKLENLLPENNKLALRKVDLVDWKSDLARQLTKEYQFPALPFTLIFDEQGKLIGRVEGNDIEAVKIILKNSN